MSSNKPGSDPNDRTLSKPCATSSMSPFHCFVRLRTAAECRDVKQMESLLEIWEKISEEEKAPYRTLAFAAFNDFGSGQVVTREPCLEIMKTRESDTDEKSTQELLSENDSDSRGGSPKYYSSSRSSSQESTPTPPNQGEVSYIRTFGPWENTDQITIAPEGDQQAPPNGDVNAQKYIWIYDPDTLVRLQSR